MDISLKKSLKIAKTKYFINILNVEAILEQLISKSWDKTERVIYLIENPPEDKDIEFFLEREALKILQK